MKKIVCILIVIISFYNCNSSKEVMTSKTSEVIPLKDQDTVRIANDELEYEIIIIEPGFNAWLQSVARPEGYYNQQYLENRNQIFVAEWNRRVLDIRRFDPNLYVLQINYDSHIDYGYELNYKLYNYFIYFQRTYKQRLAGFVPRI